jgi:hypothetical protein
MERVETHRGGVAMLLSSALLSVAVGASAPLIDVGVEVVAGWQPAGLRLEVEAPWLGADQRMELVDDGSVPGDIAGDHIYSGRWVGPPVRDLPLRLFASADGLPRTEIATRAVPLGLGSNRVVWALEFDGHPWARPVALALAPTHMEIAESVVQLSAFGWMGFALVYVSWLVQHVVPRRRRRR